MTDVRLIKDCGLYPSYKKIIDFTGTKSEIITKQLTWLGTKEHFDVFNVNYNKFQNKLVLEMDYEEALTYTYAVLTDITGTDTKPMFFFIGEVENLTNGITDKEPNVAFYLNLDPIMTFMGDWKLDECLVNRSHVDRWINNKPKRITPNQEGVKAYNKTIKTVSLKTGIPDNIALCVITFTSPYLKFDFSSPPGYVYDWSEATKEMENAIYYGCFLVDLDDFDKQIKTKIKASYNGETEDVNITVTGNGVSKFPSLNQIINGDFQANSPIIDNAIVSFTLTPACYLNITRELISGEYVYSFGDIPNQNIKIYQENIHTNPEMTVNEFGWLELTTETVDVTIGVGETPNLNDKLVIIFKDLTDISLDKKTLNINQDDWILPIQPSDGNDASSVYEPALFMEPYISRKIVKGDGTTVLEIPDVDYTSTTLTLRTLITANGISTVFIHGTEDVANIAEGELGIDNSVILDVVNDQWKEYLYTKRDTDRQIVSNYAWKNAIDNLIYMSYGGALVGSRSAGEEGYLTRSPVERVRNRDSKGRFASGYTEVGGNVTGLSATGKRVVGAVALAGAASIVTSLVDAHVAWDNQMQKEKSIRNEPSSVLNIGDGIETVLAGYKDYYYITQKVDDINYDVAYENFRKYGYLINKFEKPDISSRKYFNYILTNGAIVNGSINQAIRDVIASIFDAGVTIFHYDSDDVKTRNLEYTEKENIEVSLINPPTPGTQQYTVHNVTDNHTLEVVFEATHEQNYTINNVTDNHTLSVEFELNE